LNPVLQEEVKRRNLHRNSTRRRNMEREERNDRFTAIEDQYAGYEVYDRDGDKIGKVDDLFVDENDRPEYIGVKMSFLGTRSTLIPWELARVDENDRRIEVSVDKATAKEGPAFYDDEDITPDYEERVYSYYGLSSSQESTNRGAYSKYYGEDTDELRVQRSEEELRAGTCEREAGRLNVS
jgi:Lhr-like helicase